MIKTEFCVAVMALPEKSDFLSLPMAIPAKRVE
jgi:hypothetical protein